MIIWLVVNILVIFGYFCKVLGEFCLVLKYFGLLVNKVFFYKKFY